MISVQDAVKKGFTFEKVADFQLSKNTADWNEQVLNQFLEEVNYLSRDYNIEVCMSSLDENKGYGKGSIVVSYGNKKVNFPIIIKDYKISPFDVFISNGEFVPLDMTSLKKHLLNNSLGVVQNMDQEMNSGVKSPGGIRAKRAVSMDSTEPYKQQPNIEKISSLASKEDIEKLAERLVYEPDLASSFHDHTGDMVGKLVDAVRKDYETPRYERKGILDLHQIIDAKDTVAVIDNEMFDVNTLVPIKPPSVCELRIYEYPTIEDFISSNIEKITASKNGKPIAGVVLDVSDSDSFDNVYKAQYSKEEKEKDLRNRRDQIFISLDGKYISNYSDWDKVGIAFYGLPMKSGSGILEKAIKMISDNTTNDFTMFRVDNHGDGADKFFNPNPVISDTKKSSFSAGLNTGDYGVCCSSSNECSDLYVIYGSGDAYQAVRFNGIFKRIRIDGNYSYISPNIAILASGVVSVQKVANAQSAFYKMLVGKAKSVFLIPESSIIITTKFMQNLDRNNFMYPAKSLQKIYQEADIDNVKVAVGDKGYNISGPSLEPIMKVANGCVDLTTKEAMAVLRLVGVNQAQTTGILKTAINNTLTDRGPVTVYGIRGDYLNDQITPKLEKQARIKNLMKEYAASLRIDLTKEASMLSNPEAVDVVLSLNFINEDNLHNYIEHIPQMESMNSKLAELLVASRMGLTDMDEGALKKSIGGLSSVIRGLENLKLSVNG